MCALATLLGSIGAPFPWRGTLGTKDRGSWDWPDDSFFLLRPGESWGVGEGRDGFLEHFKEEKRLPLSP
ncbi:hypothetical protein Naga_101187g2 [Nannochloropsis gaditana]|uniref:Uncharacterized protein n=1 Tax=Nannochloropsis gaditana TaxID=72520 RepID=W7TJ14_9STRA|nr:hypothetical protein Naga_101187g2 [Nannochloropsis gaditana]